MDIGSVNRSFESHRANGLAIGVIGIIVSAVILYPLNVDLSDRDGLSLPSNKGFYHNSTAALPGEMRLISHTNSIFVHGI